MPAILAFVCYLLALVCFVVAALNKGGARFNLIGAGLALWVLIPLWSAAERLGD